MESKFMTVVLAYDRLIDGNYSCGPVTGKEWANRPVCLQPAFFKKDDYIREKTEILLSKNIPFAYIICWRYFVGYHTLDGDISNNLAWLLNSPILPALQDGRCLLVIDDSYEGVRYTINFYNKFTELASMLSMPEENIVFVDGNIYNQKSRNPTRIRFVYENIFEDSAYMFAYYRNFLNDIFHHSLNKPFRFLSYARHWNHSRQFFTFDLFLKDLLKYGLVSCNKGHTDNENYFIGEFSRNWRDPETDPAYEGQVKTFLDILPLILDSDLVENLALNINQQHYLNTDLSIIHETHCNIESIFISEKIYKTIIAKHPFMVMGSPGTLGLLRDLGYKTFHPYLDESYDNELNLTKRKNMILSELQRFINLSEEDRLELRKKLDRIAAYNYGYFKQYPKRNIYSLSTANIIRNHCIGEIDAV
jgi:hypothetical protein